MLHVNEIFGPTIQGEGKSAGQECVFLRLSLCNLHCIWCDTPYTWNWIETQFAHPQKFDKAKEIHKMDISEVINRIEMCAGQSVRLVVVSGGEPLLQQKALQAVFQSLKVKGYKIEIETNGTIAPTAWTLDLVDQINCSPKLSNSMNGEYETRIKPEALQTLSTSEKTVFKFVVASDSDIEEIISLTQIFNMRTVYLMAQGRTAVELNARETVVKGLCSRFGFIYTQRLHVLQWGQKRAV